MLLGVLVIAVLKVVLLLLVDVFVLVAACVEVLILWGDVTTLV